MSDTTTRGAAQEEAAKPVISYHRSYRRVSLSGQIVAGGIVSLGCVLVMLGMKLLFLPEMTERSTSVLAELFAPLGLEGTVQHIPFVGDAVLCVLNVRPEIPSQNLCLAVVGLAVFSFALLYRTPLPRPAVVIVNMLLFLVGAYAALFLALPGLFNESTLSLGEFFMEISLVVGLALPALFWLVIFPLPASVFWKVVNLLVFEIVLFCLFWLKYAMLLLLCGYGTWLVAPLVVFFLCSLLDVVYMITLFSLFVSRISRAVAKDVRVWQWA